MELIFAILVTRQLILLFILWKVNLNPFFVCLWGVVLMISKERDVLKIHVFFKVGWMEGFHLFIKHFIRGSPCAPFDDWGWSCFGYWTFLHLTAPYHPFFGTSASERWRWKGWSQAVDVYWQSLGVASSQQGSSMWLGSGKQKMVPWWRWGVVAPGFMVATWG